MSLILTDTTGHEIREIEVLQGDFDLNDTKDFQLQFYLNDYQRDLCNSARVFIDGTECGGIIGALKTDSDDGIITISGTTWRGLLEKKIVTPPSGQDYRIVSGDINEIMSNLLNLCNLGGLFIVPNEEAVSVTNWQIDRYITLYEALKKIGEATDHKLQLEYLQGENGEPGYVEIIFTPIIDLSQLMEISQNTSIGFSIEDVRNRVNHLILLGSGKLKDRMVRHLFVNNTNTIVGKKYYTGADEVVDVFDYSSAQSEDDLIKNGKKRLKELTNYQKVQITIDSDMEIRIGDIIGGRDYITGLTIAQPLFNMVYKIANGVTAIEYSVDGEMSTNFDIVIEGDE